jgi:hypothetical protein
MHGRIWRRGRKWAVELSELDIREESGTKAEVGK